MIDNVVADRATHFTPVTPATILPQGRFQLHVSIPSSRFTRSTQVQIDDRATVASVERHLSQVFGETVEVMDVCAV